jgi:TM2 domain-containing membrane protein YozV
VRAILLLALPLFAADPRPPSGIPEIDSLPLHDWRVNARPLSTAKTVSLSALIPGGGQFYGGHPVRGGFLLGLETLLFGLSAYTYVVDLPRWDRETSRYLDSADAAVEIMARDPARRAQAQADLEKWVGLARDLSSQRLRQADLANSQLAWGLGLHFYGMTDALEIARRSQEEDGPVRSVRRAFFYGLAFPGGGQLYNDRYGKCGMLWMALGASALSAWSRQNVVESLNRAVATARAEQALGLPSDLQELERDRTLYRKRRNQYFGGMAVLYLYAVMDGMVDAALSDFDKPNRYALGPGETPLSLAARISF